MSVEIVILSEDEQSACFARRFLKRRGFDLHKLQEEIAPPGEGSGEQWVRERFPRELKAAREKKVRGLIVFTDADAMGVEGRVRTLERQCREEKIPFRGKEEPVMLMIPARNIETWLAYLRGEAVNEKDKYSKYDAESDCRDQVARLDALCQKGKLPPDPPPSLERACDEWDRFD